MRIEVWAVPINTTTKPFSSQAQRPQAWSTGWLKPSRTRWFKYAGAWRSTYHMTLPLPNSPNTDLTFIFFQTPNPLFLPTIIGKPSLDPRYQWRPNTLNLGAAGWEKSSSFRSLVEAWCASKDWTRKESLFCSPGLPPGDLSQVT